MKKRLLLYMLCLSVLKSVAMEHGVMLELMSHALRYHDNKEYKVEPQRPISENKKDALLRWYRTLTTWQIRAQSRKATHNANSAIAPLKSKL